MSTWNVDVECPVCGGDILVELEEADPGDPPVVRSVDRECSCRVTIRFREKEVDVSEIDLEDVEINGEAFRGHEAESYVQEMQARIQRDLKR